MFKALSLLFSLESILLAPAPTLADGAQRELPSIEDANLPPEVFKVPDYERQICPRVGAVCLFGSGGGTVAGVDVDPTVGIVTTLARGTQVAAIGQAAALPLADAWNVDLIARFRMHTGMDPIVVAVMDYGDPDGMAKREATAVWTIDSPPVKDLGLRLVLSADDGFQSRHTYLVRVVEGVGAKEKVLAEGNFLLE